MRIVIAIFVLLLTVSLSAQTPRRLAASGQSYAPGDRIHFAVSGHKSGDQVEMTIFHFRSNTFDPNDKTGAMPEIEPVKIQRAVVYAQSTNDLEFDIVAPETAGNYLF